MLPFVELRAHSAFSFGDGTATPEALVERAAEMGYGALGLTDHADLGGVIRFALEAEKRGIRPVIGVELDVEGHPLALLARDECGFHALAVLVTRARLGPWEAQEVEEGAGAVPGRGRPELTWQDIEAHARGLHLLTGPATGELAYHIQTDRAGRADRWLEQAVSVFGRDRVSVEVQLHNVSGRERSLADALIALATSRGVPWLATNDPRYLDASGRLVHDLLTALRAGVDVDTAACWGALHPNGEWRLKGPGAMAKLWRGREEGLARAHELALDCTFDLRWLRPPLPRFPSPGDDDDAHLRELAYAGARRRWGELDSRQTSQLEHELAVIRRLGFAGFFLVMWDAVRFAKSRGILCQGRGSAANSAVAYCLEITAVDPIRHGLLFERFLSDVRTDGRTEAPDIDVDFEMDRREEVLDYMYEHYGRRHAAITCVTQTYHAPSAVQDVMRALGYPTEVTFALSKRVRRHAPSQGAEELEAGLAARFELDVETPRVRALCAALRAMDELPRMRSTHPGGFVLSREPLGEWMPIERTTMGRTILQFDKDDLDAAGVPKFDFLGLGGLSLVHRAFDAIEAYSGEKLELYTLPVDDPKTYEMISRGETIGTFQIESRAQISSILHTMPERLYDLVVQVALIRPGPIQARFVHPYTMRRRGLEPVTYLHPKLEPILRRTQGIPIFQEQAMAISMAIGGFSAAEADELRRAMGNYRKLPRLKAALEQLRRGMISNGVGDDVAAQIVEDLQSFANYGFPESHAWSFALIAYATAYLKANYPAAFYLGILNAWPMGFYPPSTLVHDARRAGVRVLPPCLRDGAWDCELTGRGRGQARGELQLPLVGAIPPPPEAVGSTQPQNRPQPTYAGSSPALALALAPGAPAPPALRIGWRFITGLGEKAGERLRAARGRGPFVSVDDVVRRAALTREEALCLARAGAFEAFEPGRRRAAWEALRAAGDTLPLAPATVLPFRPQELEGEERIFLDYLATGICIDGHPMEHLRERLCEAGVADSRALHEHRPGAPVVVAGLVVVRQRPESANGTIFLLLEDEHGFINVIVPRQLVRRFHEVVHHAPFVVVEGRFERDGRVMNVVGRRFRELPVRPLAQHSRDFQ
ncbi:MAG: DNA polymerase III subunit alpha [Longimicrobiales bacterium]